MKVRIRVESGWDEAPALGTRAQWAVTPSQDPRTPGFVVTHVPSGRQAWPLAVAQHPCPLSRAREKMVALAEIWDGGGHRVPDSCSPALWEEVSSP